MEMLKNKWIVASGVVAIMIGFVLADLAGPLSSSSAQTKAPTPRDAGAKDMTKSTDAKMPPLNEEERRVILHRGTERAFTGKYWDHFEKGAYACRNCGELLYLSTSKFESRCGWPSFDDEIPGAVERRPDPDGLRTEIICAHCKGHLGHVFFGEHLTPKDTRHCVNSVSLAFVKDEDLDIGRALFAGGCFWGMEHHMREIDGVLDTAVGYAGGRLDDPTYRDVTTGRTGHAEVLAILYNKKKVDFETLAKRFFEIHDPTTLNRQGADVGTQYRSAVFTMDEEQKETTEKLIRQLRANGYDVVTEVAPATKFYIAEEHHQDYLEKHPDGYNCHRPVKRFDKKVGVR